MLMPRSACVRNVRRLRPSITTLDLTEATLRSCRISISPFTGKNKGCIMFELFIYMFNTVRSMQGVNINDCSHFCVRVKQAKRDVLLQCSLYASCAMRTEVKTWL